MRLYTFTITPNTRKVEAFVRHFDLDVEIHHVSFKDRETQGADYLAINPMGRKLDYSECPGVAAWLTRMENLKGFVATPVKMPLVAA